MAERTWFVLFLEYVLAETSAVCLPLCVSIALPINKENNTRDIISLQNLIQGLIHYCRSRVVGSSDRKPHETGLSKTQLIIKINVICHFLSQALQRTIHVYVNRMTLG